MSKKREGKGLNKRRGMERGRRAKKRDGQVYMSRKERNGGKRENIHDARG